jgi:hypothetical protein
MTFWLIMAIGVVWAVLVGWLLGTAIADYLGDKK